MFRRNRIRILFALFLVPALFAVRMRARTRPQPPPLEVSLWYWNRPFHLSQAEGAQLKALGVRRLFARAGSFRRDGDGARFDLPQRWASSADGLRVTLVFNFAYDIVRSYGDLSNDALARNILNAAQSQREQAERAGIPIEGVQLDFDCPARRLARYAELLRSLRAEFRRRRLALSITALPTWFSEDDAQAVLRAVDFAVPQFYENEAPKPLDKFATISRLRLLERGLEQAGRYDAPFYVGLPAYGHALLYDEKGAFLGLYSGLDPRDALRHPAFRLARAFPADASGAPATRQSYIGEDILDFVAVKPGRDGKGAGCRLLYDLPTPALLAQHLAVVRANRPPNCRGVILFRFPSPAAALSLPLPSVAAALRGEKMQPDLRVIVRANNAPSEIKGAERAPIDFTLSITNVGGASALIGPNAIAVALHLDRPGVEDAALGDFDAVQTTFAASESREISASPSRADTLHFRRRSLAAGETAVIGPIRIPADGATTVRGVWSAVGPGGFETIRGVIPPTLLNASSLTKTGAEDEAFKEKRR